MLFEAGFCLTHCPRGLSRWTLSLVDCWSNSECVSVSVVRFLGDSAAVRSFETGSLGAFEVIEGCGSRGVSTEETAAVCTPTSNNYGTHCPRGLSRWTLSLVDCWTNSQRVSVAVVRLLGDSAAVRSLETVSLGAFEVIEISGSRGVTTEETVVILTPPCGVRPAAHQDDEGHQDG